MNFREYQNTIKHTAKYPANIRVLYPCLGLAGEAGKVCEKIKKVYKDNDGIFTQDKIEEIKKEMGDILWCIQALCNDLGINMQDVAQLNVDKLLSRLERGVIQGSGDNR